MTFPIRLSDKFIKLGYSQLLFSPPVTYIPITTGNYICTDFFPGHLEAQTHRGKSFVELEKSPQEASCILPKLFVSVLVFGRSWYRFYVLVTFFQGYRIFCMCVFRGIVLLLLIYLFLTKYCAMDATVEFASSDSWNTWVLSPLIVVWL